MDGRERTASYLGRSDLMLPATELERELDVKSEVSRGRIVETTRRTEY